MTEPAEGPWRYGPRFHQMLDRDAHEIVAKGHAIGVAWLEENARIMAASRQMLEALEVNELGPRRLDTRRGLANGASCH